MSTVATDQRHCEPVMLHQNRLVRRLLATTWFGPGSVFAVSFILYILVPAVWATREGNLVGHDDVDAFLASSNSYVFAIPFVLAAIAAYYRGTSDVLDRLMESKTLGRNTQLLHSTLAEAKRAPWSRILSACSTAAAIVIPTLFLLNRNHLATETWLFSSPSTPRPVAFYYVALFHGLFIYILASWTLLDLRASAVLRKIFKSKSGFTLKLVLLHPDDCMGLGPVEDMVNSVAIVLISLSFLFFMWQVGECYSILTKGRGHSPLRILHDHLVNIQTGSETFLHLPAIGMLTAWFAFCVFSPLVFFAPLTSAEQAMAAIKRSSLAELGARIVDSSSVDQIHELSRYYRRVQKARVWPFNIKTVTSFFASLGSPAAVAILTEILKRILDRL
jgi:hypothetical protein